MPIVANSTTRYKADPKKEKDNSASIYTLIKVCMYFIVIMVAWIIFHLIILRLLIIAIRVAQKLDVGSHITTRVPNMIGLTMIIEFIFPIYNALFQACFFTFAIVVTLLVVLYIVYCFIRLYVPIEILLIPIRKPLLNMTPFIEFQKSGVFPLFDNTSNALTPNMPMPEKAHVFFTGLSDYMKTSIEEIFTKGMYFAPPPDPPDRKSAYNDKYTKTENESIAKEFDECMGKITPVSDDMNIIEKTVKSFNNNTEDMLCRIEKLKTSFNIKTSQPISNSNASK